MYCLILWGFFPWYIEVWPYHSLRAETLLSLCSRRSIPNLNPVTAFWVIGATQVSSLSLELAVYLCPNNRAISKVYQPYSQLLETPAVSLHLVAMALSVQRKLRLLGISSCHRIVYVFVAGSYLLVESICYWLHHAHFTALWEAPHVTSQNQTIVVTKQVKSLLLTFEHFTDNIVSVRCYVLNQTTVVPKYYVHNGKCQCNFLLHWQFHR